MPRIVRNNKLVGVKYFKTKVDERKARKKLEKQIFEEELEKAKLTKKIIKEFGRQEAKKRLEKEIREKARKKAFGMNKTEVVKEIRKGTIKGLNLLSNIARTVFTESPEYKAMKKRESENSRKKKGKKKGKKRKRKLIL